jgi:hypothetical protein
MARIAAVAPCRTGTGTGIRNVTERTERLPAMLAESAQFTTKIPAYLALTPN